MSLRIIGGICFLAVLLPALACPSCWSTTPSGYEVAVKASGGLLLFCGGLTLARSIESTLLRAGGGSAFKSLYTAACGLSGLGVSQGLSGVYPVNMSMAVLVFAVVSLATGLLWWRFHAAYSA